MASAESRLKAAQIAEIFGDRISVAEIEDVVFRRPLLQIGELVDHFLLVLKEAELADGESNVAESKGKPTTDLNSKCRRRVVEARREAVSSEQKVVSRVSEDPPATAEERRDLLAARAEARIAGIPIDVNESNIRVVGRPPDPAFFTELERARKRRAAEYRGSTNRFFTVSDLEAAEKKREEARAEYGGFGGINRGSERVRTMDSLLRDALRVGKDELELTNRFRVSQGKPILRWHQSLCDIGVAHSRDMAEGKVPFGHKGFNARVARFPMAQRGAGENVAMCSGTSEPAETHVQGWIDSPGHRKNLLGNWTYCGIGVYYDGDRCFSTQLFART